MATTGTSIPPAPEPAKPSYQPSHARSESSSSTAYTGAQGCLAADDYPSVDYDRSAYDDLNHSSAPGSSHSSSPGSRPALGSRLLSSFQNAQPTASALTRSKTIIHSRAKSLASLVPKLNNSGAQSSPDNNRYSQQQPSNRRFGDLFNGESAPVRFGIASESPTKEKEESDFVMEYKPRFTERASPRRSMVPQTPSQQTTTTKTTWFGRKVTTPSAPPPTAPPADDLATLNIWTSLFPSGPVDELTPQAFNELLLNASTLLERMQSAYRSKTQYVENLRPEMEVQREEAEEAHTRSRHLKMQLEDMGRRAQEQDAAVRALARQLEVEKQKNAELQARGSRRKVAQDDGSDEDATPRRRKRVSGGEASDSGFESDLDRDADSTNTTPTMSPGPAIPPPALTLTRTPSYDARSRQSKARDFSPRSSFASSSGTTAVSLRSAGGKDRDGEGEAWGTVERLRGENYGLKVQMEEMQRRVQECIELVGHVQF